VLLVLEVFAFASPSSLPTVSSSLLLLLLLSKPAFLLPVATNLDLLGSTAAAKLATESSPEARARNEVEGFKARRDASKEKSEVRDTFTRENEEEEGAAAADSDEDGDAAEKEEEGWEDDKNDDNGSCFGRCLALKRESTMSHQLMLLLLLPSSLPFALRDASSVKPLFAAVVNSVTCCCRGQHQKEAPRTTLRIAPSSLPLLLLLFHT